MFFSRLNVVNLIMSEMEAPGLTGCCPPSPAPGGAGASDHTDPTTEAPHPPRWVEGKDNPKRLLHKY